MAEDTKKPKQTAAEKAQHALDVLDRKLKKVKDKIDETAATGERLTKERDELQRQRDYAAQHPALTQETTPAPPPGDTDPQKPAGQESVLGDF